MSTLASRLRDQESCRMVKKTKGHSKWSEFKKKKEEERKEKKKASQGSRCDAGLGGEAEGGVEGTTASPVHFLWSHYSDFP